MIYAGIMAAGIGVRMHRQDMPKQFLQLGLKPIIVHTLEQFFVNERIDRVVIVAPSEWVPFTGDLIVKYNLTLKDFDVITGGANKTESISLVARYIENKWGVHEGDILVAHDAIRPFVTQRIINDNIDTVKEHGAANTAMLINDAIVFSADGKIVDSVPDHSNIYAEQTPQSYTLTEMISVLNAVSAAGESLSKEYEFPRLWLRYGKEMIMVRGEYFNMKILNPYDLEVAEALLKEKRRDTSESDLR